jgi:hypothetical protein
MFSGGMRAKKFEEKNFAAKLSFFKKSLSNCLSYVRLAKQWTLRIVTLYTFFNVRG